ncbi:MAG TPA: asparaginase domain-containing protein [Steroidobacteraceae bacterium]|nr:asparaginase domain-containing protein [Steroidobacteraceae bacterium]
MSTETSQIAIVTTGGTIDKTYFDTLSTYQVGETTVEHMLKVARVTRPYKIVEAFRKDSLELTDADRKELFDIVSVLENKSIVITHGTDTMTETAKVLMPIQSKTIVLVGALQPARFAESDAEFNLGMAFAIAQFAPSGIYITMNGNVFAGDKVKKDREAGSFIGN